MLNLWQRDTSPVKYGHILSNIEVSSLKTGFTVAIYLLRLLLECLGLLATTNTEWRIPQGVWGVPHIQKNNTKLMTHILQLWLEMCYFFSIHTQYNQTGITHEPVSYNLTHYGFWSASEDI